MFSLVFTVTPVLSEIYWNTYAGLEEVPTDIPTNTTELQLRGNKLTDNADFSILIGTPIEVVALSYNKFTDLPNVTAIGSTLRELHLGNNNISSVTTAYLNQLDVLEYLNLESNKLTVFPNLTNVGDTLLRLKLFRNRLGTVTPTDLQPLESLIYLDLASNGELDISDLSPLGDTLQELDIYESGGSGHNVNLENAFVNFKRLGIIKMFRLGLAAFPNLSSACDNLTEVQGFDNSGITTIPSSYIDQCFSMRILHIAGLRLHSFPDISAMGQTLVSIDVRANQMVTINQDFARAQTALVSARLDTNRLESFPDFSGSANTLKTLWLFNNKLHQPDPLVTRSFKVLEGVYLSENELEAVPDFSQSATSLKILELQKNNIQTISSAELSPYINLTTLKLNENQLTNIADVPMPSLTELYLNDNNFHALPSFTNLGNALTYLAMQNNDITVIRREQFAGLENLQKLYLSDTLLQTIPDVQLLSSLDNLYLENCPIKAANMRTLSHLGKLNLLSLKNTELTLIPSVCPRNSLNLQLDGIETMDLCTKKMAWLKQSFFTVSYTDVMCDELGKMWSATTFDELVALQEPPPQPGDVKRKFPETLFFQSSKKTSV